MDMEFQPLFDMLKESNKGLLETIASFKSELKQDMKDSFNSVKDDINDIDKKLNKNMIYTTGELSTIREQLKNVCKAQEAQEETIIEIQKNQLTCKASNNWDTMVKAVSDLDKGLKKADDEITGMHSVEALRRKSGLDKNGNADGNISKNPAKRIINFDLPKWLPLIIALLMAAGVIGGAAAINLANSETVSSVKKDYSYYSEVKDVDTSVDSGVEFDDFNL